MAKIGVIVTGLQEVWEDEDNKIVITLEAHHRRLPSLMHKETEKDYIKRSRRIAEGINMLENLHLGNATLEQKPIKIKPSFEEY